MPKKKAEERGSKEWADALRERVKSEVAKVEMSYLDLAQLLYDVYDTPVDNDPAKGAIFTQWGFKTFKEYAEEELGIQGRKAFSLRRIWYIFETDLKEMDPILRERTLRLGWTKVRELCRVLTMKNAAKWVEKAEQMTYGALEATITEYRKMALEKKRQKDQEKMGDAVAGASFTGDAIEVPTNTTPGEEAQVEVHGTETLDVGEDGDGDAVEKYDDIPLDEVPDKQEVRQKVFAFYPDQLALVEEALSLAQKMTNSDVKSHNLTMICTDFLSTHMKAKDGADWKALLLVRLESLLGYDLIALDPKTGEFVYGLQAAKRLAKGKAKHGDPPAAS